MTTQHDSRLYLRPLFTGLLALGLSMACPAWALIKMDSDSVTMALRYGMMNQDKGFAGLLASNWIEGTDGALLNVYTPFMLLASRAARAKYPTAPTDEDLAKARKQFATMIHSYTDPDEIQRVKFAVSFFGVAATSGVNSTAQIEGIADGRVVILKPSKQYRQPSAVTQRSEIYPDKFDIVNSYYFNFNDLVRFDRYELLITPADGPPMRFTISNKQIY
jgi:hypothetical protein